MITARPQKSAFISLIVFLVVAYILLGFNIYVVFTDRAPEWFNYLILAILTPVAIFISHKVIFRYKRVSLGEKQITVVYPQFGTMRKYTLGDVDYWHEAVVRTGKDSQYRELQVKFNDGRVITMGQQEYTEYEKMMDYLEKHIPEKKRVKSEE